MIVQQHPGLNSEIRRNVSPSKDAPFELSLSLMISEGALRLVNGVEKSLHRLRGNRSH